MNAPLRTSVIVFERERDRSVVLSWLDDAFPEIPLYLVVWSTTHVYLLFPAFTRSEPLPDSRPPGIEVHVFDDPVIAQRWVDDDVCLRHAPAAGRPS